MAKLSRNARNKARTKRSLSLTRRQLRNTSGEFIKTHITLLAVLAQKGGEVVITTGTLQQVQVNMAGFNWSIGPSGVEGEFVVKLVTKEEPTAEEIQGDPDAEARMEAEGGAINEG